ncbi:MAG: 6-carboxytetrahydropterin synthase QueD [Gammaproteobacteria bacterium]|jgi:6-pyruvoyltetrahydropterin/6-carboxytetrahydropterin synthase
MRLIKEFQIEAAHLLPKVEIGHKCRRLHGHSFRIIVSIEGEVDCKHGWVMDYADISNAFKPIFDILDHNYLNDVEGLDNPTSEILARWIWRKLISTLPQLYSIEVSETCNSRCIYFGD